MKKRKERGKAQARRSIWQGDMPHRLFLCEEYRAKKKELELQTAYRIKKKRQPHGAVKQPPTNVRNVTAPSDNVSQANVPVNKNPKKSVKKSAKSKKWLWVDGNGKIWIKKSALEAFWQGMTEEPSKQKSESLFQKHVDALLKSIGDR